MKGKENKDPNSLITNAWSRDWYVPVILLMLRQWNSYGYELMGKLAIFGLQTINPGTFYRILRHMEKEGMVSSSWDVSVAGPARRVYTITQAGEAYLELWTETLDQYQKMMTMFFDLYTSPPRQNKTENGQVSPSG